MLKVYGSALGIGDPAIVQHLEQDIEHIRMGLLQLIEQNDRIGLPADLFGQLTSLIIAHIARRGTNELGNGILLHIFGHIHPNQVVLTVKQLRSQGLYQLGLAHAGGTHENKAHRAALGGNAHSAPSNGTGYRRNGLILAHDTLFEVLLQGLELLIFLRLYLTGGNLGPELNDPGQIFHGQSGPGLALQLMDGAVQLQCLTAQQGQTLIVLFIVLSVIGEHAHLQFNIRPLFLGSGKTADIRILEVHIGAGLIDQVDGLIRQEPVGDIPLRQQNCLPCNFGRDRNPMELFIIAGNSPENIHSLFNGRLAYRNRLEPALQCRILFDVLAILVKGSRAQHLNLAPGQGGL